MMLQRPTQISNWHMSFSEMKLPGEARPALRRAVVLLTCSPCRWERRDHVPVQTHSWPRGGVFRSLVCEVSGTT
jgi:hypothetical protein